MSASMFPSQTVCIIAPPGLNLAGIGALLCSTCFNLDLRPGRPKIRVIYLGGLIRRMIDTDNKFTQTHGQQFRQKALLPDFTVSTIMQANVAAAFRSEREDDDNARLVLVGFPSTKAQLDFATREGLIGKNTRFIHLTSPPEERITRLMGLTKRETDPLSEADVRTLVRDQDIALMNVVTRIENTYPIETLRVSVAPTLFVPMLIECIAAN